MMVGGVSTHRPARFTSFHRLFARFIPELSNALSLRSFSTAKRSSVSSPTLPPSCSPLASSGAPPSLPTPPVAPSPSAASAASATSIPSSFSPSSSPSPSTSATRAGAGVAATASASILALTASRYLPALVWVGSILSARVNSRAASLSFPWLTYPAPRATYASVCSGSSTSARWYFSNASWKFPARPSSIPARTSACASRYSGRCVRSTAWRTTCASRRRRSRSSSSRMRLTLSCRRCPDWQSRDLCPSAKQ
mmetsp:Transcript_27292/g.68324  ORF Transcript_27292/g.68324 Transcript_27292/m.68324 type:complete len:253 (+) Transcript_27292:174-932(+)